MQDPRKPTYYIGKGQHSVMALEHLVEHYKEECYQKQLKIQELEKDLEDSTIAVTIIGKDNEGLHREGTKERAKIKELEAQLHQQKFNNLHNLSIDQQVADQIKELRDSLDWLIKNSNIGSKVTMSEYVTKCLEISDKFKLGLYVEGKDENQGNTGLLRTESSGVLPA